MKRRCTKCGEEKELNLDNFYKAQRNQQGYHTHCRTCMVKKQILNNQKQSKERNFHKLFIG